MISSQSAIGPPPNPREVSHYDLSQEYYSEAMNDPHAFLADSKYKAFFLPGSLGAYIFSYDGDTLNLVKALDLPSAKRGVYLNDYFYVVSDTGITSLTEGTWEKAGEVSYSTTPPTVTPIIEPINPIIIPR